MYISGQLSPCLENDFSSRKSTMKESKNTNMKICPLQSVCHQSAIINNATNNILIMDSTSSAGKPSATISIFPILTVSHNLYFLYNENICYVFTCSNKLSS